MTGRDKVIKGMEFCTQHGSMCGSDCNGHYERYTDDGYVIKLVNEYRSKCPYGKCETGCVKTLVKDALELLKEQEPVAPKILDTAIPVSKTAVRFVKTYWCGACGEAINQSNVYCRKCGRAVKWDE